MRRRNCLNPDFSSMRGKRILVALSGGADSVALLLLLNEAREEGFLSLSAAHMDHGIRPESSDDAEYCRILCQKLRIPYFQIRVDIPAAAQSCGKGLETVARKIRYEWLRKIRFETASDYIALAHHLDDQAETILMHLLRGAGPEGVCGMKKVSDDLWRPLLDFRKSELMNYLHSKGISWREDATNQIADTPRNVLRLNVIPELEKSYPQAVRAIARYGESAAIEDELFSRLTASFLDKNLKNEVCGKLLQLPNHCEPAILRRAIRKICGTTLSNERLNAIVSLCQKARGKEDISVDLFAERGRCGIYFLPKQPSIIPPENLSLCGTTHLKNICVIKADTCAPQPIQDNPMKQVLLRSALEGAVLRTRMEGDRIRPLGCGEKLLSDYFIDKKIDRPLRDYTPLLARGKNILWVVGMSISEDARIRSESDEAVLLEANYIYK